MAQAIGRIGNYFNQELFGKPSTLPWALKISPAHRPPGYTQFATFQPSFLYEIIWNLCLAGFLIWLGNRRKIKPPGLMALYVAGYAGYRIFEETIRIDYSVHMLGMRLNFWIATLVCLAGLAWFVWIQSAGSTTRCLWTGRAPTRASSAAASRAAPTASRRPPPTGRSPRQAGRPLRLATDVALGRLAARLRPLANGAVPRPDRFDRRPRSGVEDLRRGQPGAPGRRDPVARDLEPGHPVGVGVDHDRDAGRRGGAGVVSLRSRRSGFELISSIVPVRAAASITRSRSN